jgi:hypothetical protein
MASASHTNAANALRKRKTNPAYEDDDAEVRHAERQSIITRVRAFDAEGAVELMNTLAERWCLERPNISHEEFVTRAFSTFGVAISSDVPLADLGSFGIRTLDEKIHGQETELIALYTKLRELKLLEDTNVLGRMTKLLEVIFHAKKVVVCAVQAKLAIHQLHCDALVLDEDLDQRLGSWSLRYRFIDIEATNNVQRVLLHLLDCAQERSLRKQDGYVFEPIVVDTYKTHAWRQVGDIKSFVFASCQKETCFEQWLNVTHSNSNMRAVLEYLQNCNDFQFPDLVKDRTVFSFRNGVYLASEDRFHEFSTATAPLSDSIVACKYFDHTFDFHENVPWRQIDTCSLDSILQYQDFHEHPGVVDWFYAVVGRLLYDVGSYDNWQIIPFMKGAAGSGKSTILLKVCKNFYEPIDIGVLSNNIERTFGLSAFWSKHLFVAPEIKSDLRIEQAEFQSVVSGEDVQVNVKHKAAFSTQWRTPGILAGNEVPAWCDNSGSIQRRIVLFDFINPVDRGDMKLGEKIDLELPRILLKANRAYREKVAAFGEQNIWAVLPAYFKNTRDGMAQATSSIEAFLASEEVVLKNDVFCAMEEFKANLKVYEQLNGFKTAKFTQDFFRTAFAKAGITRTREAREYKGRKATKEWLVGVDLLANQQSSSSAMHESFM